MTVLEAIELFTSEMIGEINHNVSDHTLHDILIDSVKDVAMTVIDTYKSWKNVE